MKQLPSFDNAQKAIRGGKDPRAFLHLGILYAQGIGTIHNEILAQYFIKKAFDMGCNEAEEYLKLGYESGAKDFGDEINTVIENPNNISRETITKLKVRIEKERIAGNIGNLARIRNQLRLFYLSFYPYIKIADLALLRRQGFRALLSIKDIDPIIKDKFLNCLDADEMLLNVCEEIKDQDVQLFLISFVELNIDIESLEIISLNLLKSYRNNNVEPLVEHLNDFVNRLEICNIQHELPVFTTQNLPPLEFSVGN